MNATMNIRVNTLPTKRRAIRVAILCRRSRLARVLMQFATVRALVIWWCARPSLERRNWKMT